MSREEQERRKAAYKYSEARELLGGICATTLSRLIKNGDIKPIPGIRLIPASEIKRYLNREPKPRLRGRNKEDRVPKESPLSNFKPQ